MLCNLQKKYIFLLILFIEGYVSLSYQMLYIRQISANLGTSVNIISWIIGIFLIALAMGYKRGGKKVDNPYKVITQNFWKSSLIATIGLSYIFIDYFFQLNNKLDNPYFLALIYSLVIVFPATYFLAQTIPLITNTQNKGTVSEISGNVLFLSTLGSFLGSIITTNILLSYLGIAITLLISSLLLCIVAFFINKENKIINFIFMLIVLTMALLNINYEKNHYVKSNQYSNYSVENEIVNDKEIKIFHSNKAYSSILLKNNYSNYTNIGYISSINQFLFQNSKIGKNNNILVIGAGGFVLSYYNSNNNYDYVDIDPDIKKVAEDNFLNKPINGNFIAMDGRQYVNHNKKIYDIVISDAYTGARSLPQTLTTIEYFSKLKDITKKDGWIIINTIQSPLFEDDFSKNINSTITDVFGFCRMDIDDYDKKMTNVLYFCKNINTNKKIYVDDKVNSDKEYFEASKKRDF